MTCPVCQRQELPIEALECPQCNAVLQGMRLIEELKATASRAPTESPRPSMRSRLPLAVGAVVLLGSGLLLGRGIVPTPASPIAATPEPISTNAAPHTGGMEPALAKTEPALPEMTKGTYTYVVRRGDTLRGIAWRLYGKASLADRLGKDNGITEPRRLPIGHRLRVFSI